MEELLMTYNPEVRLIISYLTLPFIAFIISLAQVYLWGKMLNIVKSDRAKSIIVILTLIATYTGYFFYVDTLRSHITVIWNCVIYMSISILFYVLIGFKLYDRVDNLIDKVAPDKPKKK